MFTQKRFFYNVYFFLTTVFKLRLYLVINYEINFAQNRFTNLMIYRCFQILTKFYTTARENYRPTQSIGTLFLTFFYKNTHILMNLRFYSLYIHVNIS